MYCIKFGNISLSHAFIRPWNAVRDSKIYSLTYMTPSMIDGISKDLMIRGRILRHRLWFDSLESSFCAETMRSPQIYKYNSRKGRENDLKLYRDAAVCEIHRLVNPYLILAFELEEDAVNASEKAIYLGQKQYLMFPLKFDPKSDGDVVVKKLDVSEFDSLPGTETFITDSSDPRGFYCGNNRFNKNKPMFIRIKRNRGDAIYTS